MVGPPAITYDSRECLSASRSGAVIDLECYDRELAQSLTAAVRAKMARSRPVSLEDMDGRSLPVKLRDGVARLFSPYL